MLLLALVTEITGLTARSDLRYVAAMAATPAAIPASLLDPIERHVNFSAETKRAYTRAVVDFLAFAGADPRGWTFAAAEDWRDKLLARGLDGGRSAGHRLSRVSVALYVKALKFASGRYARRASRSGHPVEDFAQDVDVPRLDGHKARYAIAEAAAAAMLATCRGMQPVDLRDRAILTLGFRTGMRRSGMAGIQLTDFERNRRGEEVVWITLKGGRRHDVPLDAKCLAAVSDWRHVLASSDVASGPLFHTFERDGQTLAGPLTGEGIYEAVQKRARLAGVGKVSPHVMRHSFISYMVALGVPTYRIKRITGQKTDSIIDHYTTDLDGEPASSVLSDEIG